MAQDKQNSIRILKASPTPAPKRSSMYVIAGFMGGILLCCGLFVFFIYAQDSEKSAVASTRTEPTQIDTQSAVIETKVSTNQNTATEPEDVDYPNQLNEQEMSALFKHPIHGANTLNIPSSNRSPFANLNQEVNPTRKETVITEKKIQKPQAVAPTTQPLPQGIVKPALLDQLDKEIELAQPQTPTPHPSSPTVQSN